MAKLGKVNANELKNFYEEIEQNLGSTSAEIIQDECVKEIAGKLYSLVVKATPVGEMRYDKTGAKVHTGGTLRRGWAIKLNTPTNKVHSADVFNNTEYASYVESGHRIVRNGKTVGYVDGQFFMQKSTNKMALEAPKIIEKKFKNYLNNGGLK